MLANSVLRPTPAHTIYASNNIFDGRNQMLSLLFGAAIWLYFNYGRRDQKAISIIWHIQIGLDGRLLYSALVAVPRDWSYDLPQRKLEPIRPFAAQQKSAQNGCKCVLRLQ